MLIRRHPWLPPQLSAASPRPYGHWETGKAGRNWALTREPGDLPAQSPNRWTGRPYGAVFRSGDGNAGAKAVRRVSVPPYVFETSAPRSAGRARFFASGFGRTR